MKLRVKIPDQNRIVEIDGVEEYKGYLYLGKRRVRKKPSKFSIKQKVFKKVIYFLRVCEHNKLNIRRMDLLLLRTLLEKVLGLDTGTAYNYANFLYLVMILV